MSKIDQVAFYCHYDKTIEDFKVNMRLTNENWIHDTVTANATVMEMQTENIAELQFNYSLGIELEIIRYVSGRHWHEMNPFFRLDDPFLSHFGVHLEEEEDFPKVDYLLVQESWTNKHTSQFLTDPTSLGYGRTYHYRIHQLSPGSYIKYIKRIPPAAKKPDFLK